MPATKAIVRPAVAFRQNPLQLARLYAMPSAVRDRAFEWRLSRVVDAHSLPVLSVIASQCRGDSLESNLIGAFSFADKPSLFLDEFGAFGFLIRMSKSVQIPIFFSFFFNFRAFFLVEPEDEIRRVSFFLPSSFALCPTTLCSNPHALKPSNVVVHGPPEQNTSTFYISGILRCH